MVRKNMMRMVRMADYYNLGRKMMSEVTVCFDFSSNHEKDDGNDENNDGDDDDNDDKDDDDDVIMWFACRRLQFQTASTA